MLYIEDNFIYFVWVSFDLFKIIQIIQTNTTQIARSLKTNVYYSLTMTGDLWDYFITVNIKCINQQVWFL